MRIESVFKGDFLIVRVHQESPDDTEVADVGKVLTEHLAMGRKKIALSLSINAYPYSKLISVLVQCSQLVGEHGGALTVIQPNAEFLEVLKQTKLDKVFSVVGSEEELGS